jgi:hypothetical protein
MPSGDQRGASKSGESMGLGTPPVSPTTISWLPFEVPRANAISGVDSARADGWIEGAVDDIVDDESAVAVGAIDGWKEATAAVLGVAADPLHAVVTNATATIEIARRRHGNRILSG